MQPARAALRFLELFATLLSFGLVYGVYLALFNDALPVRITLVACLISALAFWAATQLKDRTQDDSTPSMIFVEQFCFGAGVSLLAHALLTYGFLVRRTPFLVVGSSLVAASLLTAIRHFGRRHLRKTPRILLLGFDGLTASLLPELGFPVEGICGSSEVPPPPGIPILGEAADLAGVLAQIKPTHILIGAPGWEKTLSPEVLLRCRMAGVRVMEASGLYEKLLLRVCCERLQPVDLMLSSVLRGDSRTMAIQAVYNNLLGLFLLLFLAPMILLISLISALTSGGGVIESIECAGFQYIPFRLQRFRTTRADGSVTPVGRFLRRFRLVNLPQLINVVRGDMALVGPRPVRTEFAHHLSEVMPFYAHRFSVKPGLTGWAQAHLSDQDVVDTRLEIEYDLYYVKEGSLWLDLEILFDRLVGKTATPAGA
jgi:lipopolysaccharide/colanic/teichoic acid biosynthesis glycosyltransferase